MLENTTQPTQPPPPAVHRHMQQSDLPAEQIYTREPAPKGRLAGCILAVLLSSWMLAVPIALVDRLAQASAPAAGMITAIIVITALLTAGLGCFRLTSVRDERLRLSFALNTALVAAMAVSAVSAIRPEYGLLLLVPTLLAGTLALSAMAKDGRAS